MANENGAQELINSLKIASPCPMLWDNMQRTPEEAVRFCGECRKNVYDVSKMSALETSLLLQKAEIKGGSACMQLYRRADGTVITDDCPVGLRRIRDTWRKVRSAVAAFALLLTAQSAFAQGKPSGDQGQGESLRGRVAAPLRGEPAMPPQPLGGAVAPSVPTGGKPVAYNWRDTAMKNPSVKALANKIADAQKKSSGSDADKLKVLQLRYDMAQEANKRGVPSFSLGELSEVQAALQATGAPKSDKLLKDVLNAKMAVSKKLGITDTKCIQDELDKIK